MDFKKFYDLISDHEKLKYLDVLLQSNKKLQQDFKLKVSIDPKIQVEDNNYSLSFAQLVEYFKNSFEADFSDVNFTDFDWEDIYIPRDRYVEDWELVENYCCGLVSDLFISVKDLFIQKLVEARYRELLAASIALYDVCENLDIDDGDYCVADCIFDTFYSESNEVLKFISKKIENVSALNTEIVDSLLQFFTFIFSEYENKNFGEKELETLIYIIMLKIEDSSKIFNLFANNSFKFFPRISDFLINKHSNEDKWVDFAINHYKKDRTIAEKLLQKLNKTDSEKFISVAFSLIKNPFANKDNLIDLPIDEVYYTYEYINRFLLPMINYKEHKLLFVAVNLNLANSLNQIENYISVRDYLSLEQKQLFIKKIIYKELEIKVYIVENKLDEAKEILKRNSTLNNLKELIRPFTTIDPDFCFNYITSFIDEKIQTERGRDVYYQIACLLNFSRELKGFNAKTLQYSKKLYVSNTRLSALKDEFIKAKLINPLNNL